MADEVWLHIGTPKSGTSSLQRYLCDHREALAGQGLTYVAPEDRTSANELVVAMNKGKPDLAALAADLNRRIEAAGTPHALLSSEMLYGVDPDRLYALLPALSGRRVKVLVYLRRQDRYIEAMFLQKSKNGRFSGSIADYIEKFDGSGSDFHATLKPWADHAEAHLVPRVLEPARLVQGDVVADALAQIGLPPPEAGAREVNVSPGYHRVQLLQAAASVAIADPRRLQRQLAARYPQAADERGPILDPAARRAWLARHADGNEALRARYFPDWPQLFDTSDLTADGPPASGIPPFTPAQLREIARLLEVVKVLR